MNSIIYKKLMMKLKYNSKNLKKFIYLNLELDTIKLYNFNIN